MKSDSPRTGVRLGEFPFPLRYGPEESRYLTWIRNHSNYMAVGGILDYARAVGVLVRGMWINFLIFLPYLLIIALAVSLYSSTRFRGRFAVAILAVAAVGFLMSWRSHVYRFLRAVLRTFLVLFPPGKWTIAGLTLVALAGLLLYVAIDDWSPQGFALFVVLPFLGFLFVFGVGSVVGLLLAVGAAGLTLSVFVDTWSDLGFPLTLTVVVFAVAWSLLFALGTPLFKIRRYRSILATGSDSSVKSRDQYERSFGIFVVAFVAVFTFESLAYFLPEFHHIARDTRWSHMAGLTAVAVAVLSCADRLLASMAGVMKQVAIVVVGLLGALVPLTVVLLAAHYVKYRPPFGDTEPLMIATLFLSLGILFALAYGWRALWWRDRVRGLGLAACSIMLFGLLAGSETEQYQWKWADDFESALDAAAVGLAESPADLERVSLALEPWLVEDMDEALEDADLLTDPSVTEFIERFKKARSPEQATLLVQDARNIPTLVGTEPCLGRWMQGETVQDEYDLGCRLRQVRRDVATLASFSEELNGSRSKFYPGLPAVTVRALWQALAGNLDAASDALAAFANTGSIDSVHAKMLERLRNAIETDANQLADDPALAEFVGELKAAEPWQATKLLLTDSRGVLQEETPRSCPPFLDLYEVRKNPLDMRCKLLLLRRELASAASFWAHPFTETRVAKDVRLLSEQLGRSLDAAAVSLARPEYADELRAAGGGALAALATISPEHAAGIVTEPAALRFVDRLVGEPDGAEAARLQRVQLLLKDSQNIPALIGPRQCTAADLYFTGDQVKLGCKLLSLRREIATFASFSEELKVAGSVVPNGFFASPTAGNARYRSLPRKALFVAMLAVLLLFVSWLTVDVNLTSIHGLYRDRLATAFLVGEDTEGDVDIEEDLNLDELSRHEADSIAPYHLINAAINLQGSTEQSVRDRKSDYFVFSKRFTGGERAGYCRSEAMERVFPQMDLATAMAISAGAASPNMGRATNPGLVAIMTLLNIRLGFWVPNPGLLEERLAIGGDVEASPLSFDEVFDEELCEIARRWQNLPDPSERRLASRERAPLLASGTRPRTVQHGLVGIAYSGGGIRSATLNLGITQALHARGVFDHVDYMSTVSGGGYLGSSLSALMRQRRRTASEIAGTVTLRETAGAKIVRVDPPDGSGEPREHRFALDAQIAVEDKQSVVRGQRLIHLKPVAGSRSEIAGTVSLRETAAAKIVSVRPPDATSPRREHHYAKSARLAVADGDAVVEGQRLVEKRFIAQEAPSFGLFFAWRVRPIALLREIVGKLDETHRWVNVSDGGHIENLAVIELLRRRCKFIVVGDGEADPEHGFHGLATLMRSARIDLGIHIDIDVDELRLSASRVSKRHWALGRVHYPGEDEVGYLLYLKSSITGDEDEAIREYRHGKREFPHESTADQSFTEGQFEAYRSLGQHIAEEALAHAVGGKLSHKDLGEWFEALERHDPPAGAVPA